MGSPASLPATPWQAPFSTQGRERSLVPAEGSHSPTAAVVVQGSSEGGAVEPSADGGESRRPQGARTLTGDSDLWASPEWKGGGGPDIGHSLATVSHGGRRAPVTLTPLQARDFKSYKYLYYQQLKPITSNNTPYFTTPKFRSLDGLLESRLCWHLLPVTAAD